MNESKILDFDSQDEDEKLAAFDNETNNAEKENFFATRPNGAFSSGFLSDKNQSSIPFVDASNKSFNAFLNNATFQILPHQDSRNDGREFRHFSSEQEEREAIRYNKTQSISSTITPFSLNSNINSLPSSAIHSRKDDHIIKKDILTHQTSPENEFIKKDPTITKNDWKNEENETPSIFRMSPQQQHHDSPIKHFHYHKPSSPFTPNNQFKSEEEKKKKNMDDLASNNTLDTFPFSSFDLSTSPGTIERKQIMTSPNRIRPSSSIEKDNHERTSFYHQHHHQHRHSSSPLREQKETKLTINTATMHYKLSPSSEKSSSFNFDKYLPTPSSAVVSDLNRFAPTPPNNLISGEGQKQNQQKQNDSEYDHQFFTEARNFFETDLHFPSSASHNKNRIHPPSPSTLNHQCFEQKSTSTSPQQHRNFENNYHHFSSQHRQQKFHKNSSPSPNRNHNHQTFHSPSNNRNLFSPNRQKVSNQNQQHSSQPQKNNVIHQQQQQQLSSPFSKNIHDRSPSPIFPPPSSSSKKLFEIPPPIFPNSSPLHQSFSQQSAAHSVDRFPQNNCFENKENRRHTLSHTEDLHEKIISPDSPPLTQEALKTHRKNLILEDLENRKNAIYSNQMFHNEIYRNTLAHTDLILETLDDHSKVFVSPNPTSFTIAQVQEQLSVSRYLIRKLHTERNMYLQKYTQASDGCQQFRRTLQGIEQERNRLSEENQLIKAKFVSGVGNPERFETITNEVIRGLQNENSKLRSDIVSIQEQFFEIRNQSECAINMLTEVEACWKREMEVCQIENARVLILQSHFRIQEKQKDEYIANKEKLIEKLKEKGRKLEQSLFQEKENVIEQKKINVEFTERIHATEEKLKSANDVITVMEKELYDKDKEMSQVLQTNHTLREEIDSMIQPSNDYELPQQFMNMHGKEILELKKKGQKQLDLILDRVEKALKNLYENFDKLSEQKIMKKLKGTLIKVDRNRSLWETLR